MLQNYWWVAGLAVLPILFLLLRHMAKTKAKMVALKWIAIAERMIFETGDEMITFVAQQAYGLLSSRVKLFIPYAVFNILVRELYDELKDLIEETHKKAAQ